MRQNVRQSIWITIMAIYGVLLFLVYFYRLGGIYYEIILNILNVVTLMFPILFGLDAIRFHSIQTTSGKSVFFLWLAMVFYLIGDLIWAYLGEPIISVADLFWLATYPLIMFGVFLGIRALDTSFLKKKYWIFIFLVAAAVAYYTLFPVSWSEDVDFLENILTIGYVIGDLLLLLPMIFIISFLFSEYNNLSWMMIGVGIISYMLGDFLYSLNYETYAAGDLLDFAWMLSYLFFGAGFIMLKDTQVRG